MDLLNKRIQKIKQMLKQNNLDKAASILVSTMASDDMFKYWSECCNGSERVPKILKYITHIAFDAKLRTANINFMKGHLCIGSGFFLDHIDGPEDLLFILIHERNHLILRRLYPDVRSGINYPARLFNFGQDAYINAIARRYVTSTLPERFYKEPLELILTGRHSVIDWDYFKCNGGGFNRLQDAHGAIYKNNYALLKKLRERYPVSIQGDGYKHWMALICEWHHTMSAKADKAKATANNIASGINEANKKEEVSKDNDVKDDRVIKNENGEKGAGENNDDVNHEQKGGDGAKEVSESKEEVRPPLKNKKGGDKKEEVPEENLDKEGQDQPGTNIESTLKNIIPLIQKEDSGNCPITSTNDKPVRTGKMLKIPLPDLKPDDPVVQIILSTCELQEFRKHVIIFDERFMMHVEKMIRGVLSERALERFYDGYSISVPLSMTRRDVFAMSAGAIPVMWQTRVGVKKPHIDIYVDVSGSMGKYYGYIPFIYDALKHVMGRIFHFSTIVVEADYKDKYLYSTGGTSFNSVAEHMIDHKVKSVILLSDGKSFITENHIKILKRQLEYFVYIKICENQYRNWERLAKEVIILKKENN